MQLDELIVESIGHRDKSYAPTKQLHSANPSDQIFDGLVRDSLLGALVLLVLLVLAIGLVDHWITRRRVAKSGAVVASCEADAEAGNDCKTSGAVTVELDFINRNALDAPQSPTCSKSSDNADTLLLERSPARRRDNRP